MKQVYTHRDITRVGHYQSLLEEEQIFTVIRNEQDYGCPIYSTDPLEPSLCVVNDADYEAALKIIQAYEFPEEEFGIGEPWNCAACGAQVDAGFDPCWNCGAAKP